MMMATNNSSLSQLEDSSPNIQNETHEELTPNEK